MALKLVVERALDGRRFSKHDFSCGDVNDPNFLPHWVGEAFCGHDNGQSTVYDE